MRESRKVPPLRSRSLASVGMTGLKIPTSGKTSQMWGTQPFDTPQGVGVGVERTSVLVGSELNQPSKQTGETESDGVQNSMRARHLGNRQDITPAKISDCVCGREHHSGEDSN